MYKVWLKSVQNLKYGIYQKHINIIKYIICIKNSLVN